ncbi:MAG: hypothetical protein D6808_06440 [Candidatus Dadabacteria bacterium]|nr:MAG: hypothetical protein D6808_06440 [Candidatus Dadabacteria bacterium]
MERVAVIDGELDKEGLPEWFSHLGVGVFDTLRADYRQKEKAIWIYGYRAHVDRFMEGATELLGFAPEVSNIESSIKKILQTVDWDKNPHARLRLIAMGSSLIVTAEPLKFTLDQEKGISAISFKGERFMPSVKSCSALVSVIARKEMYKRGAQEAFLIDKDGILREGSWSNFFWVDSSNTIYTTKTKILNGVTRDFVIQLFQDAYKIEEKDYTLDHILNSAKEAFLTQSSHWLVPVIEIDKNPIGSGSVGPVTKELIRTFKEEMEKGELPYVKRFSL